jgi:hypothetical protein
LPEQYTRLTWRQFVTMTRGYNKRRSLDFEHTRAICYHVVAVNRDPKKPFPTIQKFWELPTDKDNLPDEETEYKRLRGLLDKYKKGKMK